MSEEVSETKKTKKPSRPTRDKRFMEITRNPRVDLLPSDYLELVALRRMRRFWIYIFAVVVAVAIATSLGFYAISLIEGQKLSSEQANQKLIESQISQYAEADSLLNARKEARNLMEKAGGSEVDWQKFLDRIISNLPEGTELQALDTVVGSGNPDEDGLGIRLVLTSDGSFGYSDTLKSIQSMGVTSAVDISGLATSGDNRYDFTVSFTLDSSVLTGRYIQEETE